MLILSSVGMVGAIYGNSTQHENVTQATKWYGVVKKIPSYVIDPAQTPSFQSVTYYIQGDTTINETIYQAMYSSGDVFCAGLRKSANGQQVYIHPSGNLLNDPWWDSTRQEYLLYDFDVQKGDTVWAIDGSFSGIDDMGIDVSAQYRWIVEDVQTIVGRKHVWVQGGQMNHLVEWIEGIGTRYILFENVYEDVLFQNFSTWALCAEDSNNNVIYSFDTDEIGVHNKQCEWEEIQKQSVEIPHDNTDYVKKYLKEGRIIIQRNGLSYSIIGARIKRCR